MTIRELAEKCKDRNEQCKGCPYTQECEAMSERTPSVVIELVENNEEIS